MRRRLSENRFGGVVDSRMVLNHKSLYLRAASCVLQHLGAILKSRGALWLRDRISENLTHAARQTFQALFVVVYTWPRCVISLFYFAGRRWIRVLPRLFSISSLACFG